MANLRPAQYAGSCMGRVDLPSYISGYVDGEGCFTASISPRPTLRVGWEVRPSLSVSQNGDRNEVLLEIQDYFGCGTLRPRPQRQDREVGGTKPPPPHRTSNPHFHRYPLRSGKNADFELFASTCEAMASGRHLEPEGLREIVRWADAMNPSGTR